MTAKNPQNRRLGYARVSTSGQTLDAQLAQLRKEGCAKIYREKSGGARPDRVRHESLPRNLHASLPLTFLVPTQRLLNHAAFRDGIFRSARLIFRLNIQNRSRLLGREAQSG